MCARRPGECAYRENAHTRPTRRYPLRLRSTTIVCRETFDRPCAEHVCYCRVVSPSGRSVGDGCGAAVTVYTARAVHAPPPPSPHTRLHPTTHRRNITGDRVATAVVVPSSPRQLRRRRRRSRERRGPFLFTSPPQPRHSQQHEIFTQTLEQCKNHPTPLFRCSRKTLGAYYIHHHVVRRAVQQAQT